ncbi:MAG: ATP synthase F1 subunit gamma [Myxococcota bacterium]
MPSLKDIRRRIDSVKKTQQITRAMRMVAAAKLRRAEDAIRSARPYAERMRETLGEVAKAQADVEHPLLQSREEVRNVEVVVITSDRGLAGAFNASVLKDAEDAMTARESEGGVRISITALGNKARDYFRRRRPEAIRFATALGNRVEYAQAAEIAQDLARRFAEGEVDEVVLVYNEFVSIMTQRPTLATLLPFAPPGGEAEGDGEEEGLPYEIEPSPEKLLAVLVPKALEIEVFRALLENQAGEHAARMTAMENATRNTEELIERLTLDFNRARQAAITRELVEIVTGAQALD